MFISLSQAKYNIINWHFYHTYWHHSSSLWYIQFCQGVNVNTPIDYSSRYSFGHFCCRVKQGKRLSEFLQKYTDSGTESTHLAGYNILVFKYVNISAGLPLLSIGAIRERSSKVRYCIIWRCLHLMFTTTNVSEKWNKQVFLVLERYIGFEPRFEIINAVTDEPKGTIFSVISLIISTD